MNKCKYEELKSIVSEDGSATDAQKDYIKVLSCKLGYDFDMFRLESIDIDKASLIIKDLRNRLKGNKNHNDGDSRCGGG